ncbi:hypothetical protein AAG570_012304 [Ranatra chinensis]|uniref:Uncharacterized protein n=1 Tax=Ranatra chinensis TaxID=642074 RepID=A0ABD0YUS0_9HEMI
MRSCRRQWSGAYSYFLLRIPPNMMSPLHSRPVISCLDADNSQRNTLARSLHRAPRSVSDSLDSYQLQSGPTLMPAISLDNSNGFRLTGTFSGGIRGCDMYRYDVLEWWRLGLIGSEIERQTLITLLHHFSGLRSDAKSWCDVRLGTYQSTSSMVRRTLDWKAWVLPRFDIFTDAHSSTPRISVEKVPEKFVLAIEVSPFQSSVGIPRYSPVKRKEAKIVVIPLPTYLWEELRRQRVKGGYPWTHLYKPPYDEATFLATIFALFPPITFDGIPIPPASCARYLGLYIDKRVSKRHRPKQKIRTVTKLALGNKLTIYNMVLKPTRIYGTKLWGISVSQKV